MATNNQYCLEKILESLREMRELLGFKTEPKHDRTVLICGATQDDDCLCVVAESLVQSQLLDPVIKDNGDEAFKEKIVDPIPLNNQVGEAEDCFCVATEVMKSEYDLDVVDVKFFANLKEFHIAVKVFEKIPERMGYITDLDPKPPDGSNPLQILASVDSFKQISSSSINRHVGLEGFYVENVLIDKCSKVDGYIAEPPPKPPDDYHQLIQCRTTELKLDLRTAKPIDKTENYEGRFVAMEAHKVFVKSPTRKMDHQLIHDKDKTVLRPPQRSVAFAILHQAFQIHEQLQQQFCNKFHLEPFNCLFKNTAAFVFVCPNNLPLIGRNYKRLCEILPDVEVWGQLVLIGILLRYVIVRLGLGRESIMLPPHSEYYNFEKDAKQLKKYLEELRIPGSKLKKNGLYWGEKGKICSLSQQL